MGGSSGTQKTVSNQEPWAEQKPYLVTGMQEAKKIFDAPGPAYFPQSTVAGFSPEQNQAFGLATNRATNGSASMRAAEGFNQDILGGKYSGDPYQSQVFDNIKSQVMPAVNSNFMAAGRYGSGAHADSLARGMTEAFAPYASQQYQQGLDRMTGARDAAQGFAANDYQDIGALADVGRQRQTLGQSELDDARARYDYAQDLPANKLGQYQGFIGGNYGGTTTSAQPYNKPSVLSQILGGGIGLAGLFG